MPIAEKILPYLKHSIVAFYGEMGVGKTTFITAICKALGVEGKISSPTYSLVNEYETRDGNRIYHFDFYRIKTLNEAYDLGYEEYFYSGNKCLVEWPEKIEELFPKEVTKIFMTEENGVRNITIE